MSGGETFTRVDEIVDGIYRVSTWRESYGITFNQFLIDDERPALIHTGAHPLYEDIRGAISEVLDPSKLEFVAFLHLESDECGSMDQFLGGAPGSTLVGCRTSIDINIRGWNYYGPVQGYTEGEVLDLGRHKLRFLETPHVHHWDSMMLFDETTKSVFPADLYLQPGEQPPTVTENLGAEMCDVYRFLGLFAHENPVRRVVDRLEALDPEWIHPMHGGSLKREAIPAYNRALRERDFAFEGRLIGREILAGVDAEVPEAYPTAVGAEGES